MNHQLSNPMIDEVSGLFSALGDASRLKILRSLLDSKSPLSQGAVAEARAHLARAEGDDAAAGRLLAGAVELFTIAGQPLDAQRCLDAADS